ncbi:hypothetical protein ACFQ7J_02415 [Streptomyces sp. NPDC056501]|uniref:hypothetical protein n=1 Tax=Streptomyces sp. NPDC056501 TaxID=3345841 RepID=UPI0036B880CD
MKRLVMSVLVMGSLVVSCTSAQEEAKEHAVKACAAYDAYGEKRDDSDTEAPEETQARAAAARFDDEAALAASKDMRWDQLSDAMTGMQEVVVQAAIASDEARSDAERDAAMKEMAQLDHGVVALKAQQECEKVTG